jgi:hypothetical protein
MQHLPHLQKLAILHMVYQVIASADGAIDETRDADAIELSLDATGFGSIYSWDEALRLDPNDCMFHISMLSAVDFEAFSNLLFSISQLGGNTQFRDTCTKHLIQMCTKAH